MRQILIHNEGAVLKLSAPLAATILLLAMNASAQATRTWVSGVGDDANPCSRTAPCKTFAGAISKTAASGEINALDPGGYGAVTITKSITIDGGGQIAGVLVSGTNGIVINAANTDVVTLRRIQIDGLGSGLDGVHVILAKQVNIEDAEIFGFTGAGVAVTGTMTAGNVRVAKSTLTRNNYGVSVSAGNVAITSSDLTANTTAGVDATGNTSVVLLANSELTTNGRGVRSASGATVRLTHNDIIFNTTYAWEILAGGVIQTHVDNRTAGASVGTLTAISYP